MIRSSAAALAALLASSSLSAVAMAQTAPSAAPAPAPASSGFATSEATDPYIWLEDVEGARAMEWVREHNEKSLGVLQGDPRYEPLHQEAWPSSRPRTASRAWASTATAR